MWIKMYAVNSELKSLDINAYIPLRRKALWKQSDQFKIKK
jgi:hypothetical protein